MENRQGPAPNCAPKSPLSPVAMASTLRKLKSLVLFQTTDTEQIADLLETVSVPLHTGDCRSCPDPCTEGNAIWLQGFACIISVLLIHSLGSVGHEDWNFSRDMETQMLGTVKPYTRQVKKNKSPTSRTIHLTPSYSADHHIHWENRLGTRGHCSK